MVAAVRLQGVSRHFGAVRAVDDVSLEIADGEFFSMLGPSGSGKTTCLRLIAGFEHPTSGHIEIHGRSADGVPPFERDVNTVFQDYALFPHMSVRDNVAYGLMVRRVPRAQRYRRAAEALELVKLEGFGQRRPAELSGGQRQRVALARALINHPRVLLLDEPLGALDRQLREQMQVELKSLQRRVGITFVFVTHDQEEALSMSDRLAVFDDGRIEQIGTPREIYEHPATPFVAGFVGVANIIDAGVAAQLGQEPVAFSVRPERIRLLPDDAAGDGLVVVTAAVTELRYLGASTAVDLRLDVGTALVATLPNVRDAAPGELETGRRVRIGWHPGDMQRLDGRRSG